MAKTDKTAKALLIKKTRTIAKINSQMLILQRGIKKKEKQYKDREVRKKKREKKEMGKN